MNIQKIKKNKSGFTLLEIIIVIIIVGVLASLALPRLFSNIEFSRSTEALATLGVIRKSMERCYLFNSAVYTGCDVAGFTALDIDNPDNAPGAHFAYTFTGAAADASSWEVTATRNAVDGGDGVSTLVMNQDNSGAGSTTRSGTTVFSSMK